MLTTVLDPERALVHIFEYAIKNGMVSILITSTLEQRMNSVGELTVTPFVEDLEPLVLKCVALPTWVARQSQMNVNYPVSIMRANIT